MSEGLVMKGQHTAGQIVIDQKEQLILYKKELMIAKWTQAELDWRKMMDRWQQDMSQLGLLHDKWNNLIKHLEKVKKSTVKKERHENSHELWQAEIKLKNMVAHWKYANRKWKQTAYKRKYALIQWNRVIDDYGMVIYKKNQTVNDLEQTINHLEKVANDWEKSRNEELLALKRLELSIEAWQQTIKKLESVMDYTNINKKKKLKKIIKENRANLM